MLDAQRIEVLYPPLQIVSCTRDEADGVVARDGGSGMGRPAQLDGDVEARQLNDHRVADAGTVVVVEPGEVLGIEHPLIPGEAGVEVGPAVSMASVGRT